MNKSILTLAVAAVAGIAFLGGCVHENDDYKLAAPSDYMESQATSDPSVLMSAGYDGTGLTPGAVDSSGTPAPGPLTDIVYRPAPAPEPAPAATPPVEDTTNVPPTLAPPTSKDISRGAKPKPPGGDDPYSKP